MPPDPHYKGGREGMERERRVGKGEEQEGREGEGMRFGPPNKFLDPPVLTIRSVNIAYFRNFAEISRLNLSSSPLPQVQKYWRYFNDIEFQ